MRVLIIDDDESMRYALGRAVRRLGFESLAAETAQEGLEKAIQQYIDAVFLDVRLPDCDGLTILPQLAEMPSRPEVIIITGAGDPDGAELAITNGAWDYIEKTASIQEITLTLKRALDFRRERVSARKGCPVRILRRDSIVGESPSLLRCLDQVAQCAQTDASVLITGETGTGKELFARAIHDNSSRAAHPFVVVDCAALPEHLVESMLFGHRKGAFTGADKDRLGLVQRADGGTLFLDEIGELPVLMQKAFLRVLQERKVRPLGSGEETRCDFRLVAATNKDIDKMVTTGAFRDDLLFRLRSFHIDLPSLHERKQDIRAIANAYLDKEYARTGLERKGCYSDFFDMLHDYDWPGNVRELLHALDHALAASINESCIFARHLPPQLRAKVTRNRVSPASAQNTQDTPEAACGVDLLWNHYSMEAEIPPLNTFRESVIQQAEARYLRGLMLSVNNSVREAIRISGLSQSRLYALLKKYGIATS
ncbi:sigma-54-dependent transcriptional regulator [Oleidesulfovibrio sp.]|uniref:sigma-54-dependent transcriptional regulator n=1 Tax=Oleidesulfovibrio sp. TaxID=2909707 RepID=UPI003A8C36E0